MKRNLFPAVCVLLAVLVAGLAPATLAAGEADAKVDINRADAATLETLPGVGPQLAVRIIEYRENEGPFQRVEDLMNVRGIGEKSFLKLRDRITVGEPKKKG